MTRIRYQITHSFFASASGFDILLKMNNTIRSARKEGRHDNDGAQTEVAVVMTSYELWYGTADDWRLHPKNRGTEDAGRFPGRGVPP